MKLGLCGHKEDSRGRTLRLRDFFKRDLAYPASCDLTEGLVPDDDDLGNKTVGCCAIAGPGHFVRWEDQLCKREVRVEAPSVLGEYQMLSGWTPGNDASDVGCYALDVFKRWRSVGLFGTRIEAFAQVEFRDSDEVAAATFLLGGVFLCLNLPKRVAAGDIFEADVWDIAKDDGGCAGGHLVWKHGDAVNTWGKRVVVTPPFTARYGFDAYAVASADALKPDGRAYSGLDLAGLAAALARVTA